MQTYVSDIFDLSLNALTGAIPSGLGKFQGVVRLNGNIDFTNPAPLDLCLLEGFDSASDTTLCPPERTALSDFYFATKGQEWTNSEHWLSQYTTHCSWHGVTCDTTNTSVLNLTLHNNGLSGRMSAILANLTSLEYLDLSDNYIKGSIPTEIGSLAKLTHLRLSYNAFSGLAPTELGRLLNLNLFHLHGNRIVGTMPDMDIWFNGGQDSFIADCGVPTDFPEPLACEHCTMCCNVDGYCHVNKDIWFEKIGFTTYITTYLQVSWLFSLVLFVLFCLVAMLSYFHQKKSSLPSESQRHLFSEEMKLHAVETIGKDSVYSFVLSKSRCAWVIFFVIWVSQIVMNFVFISAASLDFTDDTSQFVYSFKCPAFTEECKDEDETTPLGWLFFALIMIGHVLADFVNGIKLLILSGGQELSRHRRIRLFIGGLCLCFVSSLTVFSSVVYNQAIARSDPDIIINSILILFIAEIDEKFYKLVSVFNPSWVKGLKADQNAQAAGTDPDIEMESKDDNALETRVENLEEEVKELKRLLLSTQRGTPENDVDAQEADSSSERSDCVTQAEEPSEPNAIRKRTREHRGSIVRLLNQVDTRNAELLLPRVHKIATEEDEASEHSEDLLSAVIELAGRVGLLESKQ